MGIRGGTTRCTQVVNEKKVPLGAESGSKHGTSLPSRQTALERSDPCRVFSALLSKLTGKVKGIPLGVDLCVELEAVSPARLDAKHQYARVHQRGSSRMVLHRIRWLEESFLAVETGMGSVGMTLPGMHMHADGEAGREAGVLCFVGPDASRT